MEFISQGFTGTFHKGITNDFKVLISNIHCSKIERYGLLWCSCTRFTNQIEFLIWHICFLYTQNIDIFSTSSQFHMWNLKLMDLFQGCKGTRQNTNLRIWSAEGGQAGGSKKSVTPSFPKFWIAFLNTFRQKKNRCFMVQKHHF